MKPVSKVGLAGLAVLICILEISCGDKMETKSIPAKSSASACVQLRAELERMSCGGTVANDWGELAQYRDADAQIGQATPGLPRIVFIGDSITFGWPGLGAKGHFEGVDVFNRGITGQLTAQMLLRFRQDVVDLHPQVVVILGGSNDIERVMPPALPVIEGNLASMAQLAKANGIRAVISSIPPVHDSGHDERGNPLKQTRTHPSQQIRELNDWLRKFAKENGCVFVDYYSALIDRDGFLKKEYSEDGLHPNAAGYAVMEPLVVQAIKEAAH